MPKKNARQASSWAIYELISRHLDPAGSFAGSKPPPPMKPTVDLAKSAGWGPVILDAQMRRMFGVLDQVAPTGLPVLLLGETGTGKEVAAEWVHRRSARPPHRFLRINCASLNESVVESELFGHERGAFTGALYAREGLFEAADGGTLFLDEIAELAPRTQAKLLRVLESGELLRVGSTRTRRVDV